MKKINLNFNDLVCPVFTEFDFIVSPEAVHPNYTLKMNLPLNGKPGFETKTGDGLTYCNQLFEKSIQLESYDYKPFILSNLDNIVDRHEWLNSFMLLILFNKELFLKYCEIEKYTYLFTLINRHYNAFNSDLQSPLHENCEACHHKVAQRIYRAIKVLEDAPAIEKRYLMQQLSYNLMQFDNLRTLKFDKALYDQLNHETKILNEKALLLKELIEERDLGALEMIPGQKKIKVNCSAVVFGKIYGEIIKNAKDENGVYLFDCTNTVLADSIVKTIYFRKGAQVNANTMRDYLPSPRNHDDNLNIKGLGR